MSKVVVWWRWGSIGNIKGTPAKTILFWGLFLGWSVLVITWLTDLPPFLFLLIGFTGSIVVAFFDKRWFSFPTPISVRNRLGKIGLFIFSLFLLLALFELLHFIFLTFISPLALSSSHLESMVTANLSHFLYVFFSHFFVILTACGVVPIPLTFLGGDISNRIMDMITKIRSEDEKRAFKKINHLAEDKVRLGGYIILIGILIFSLFFIFLIQTPLFNFIFYFFGITGLLYVIVSIYMATKLDQSLITERNIKKGLKRLLSGTFVELGIILASIALLFYFMDALFHFHVEHIVPIARDSLSTKTIGVLNSHSSFLSIEDFIEIFTAESLSEYTGYSLEYCIKIFVSAIIIIGLTPPLILYIYLEDLKKIFKIVAVYSVFFLINFLVGFLLSGEIAHLREIGISSLLPPIGIFLSGEITRFFKKQIEYIDCPNCGEQIDEEYNVCPCCEHELD